MLILLSLISVTTYARINSGGYLDCKSEKNHIFVSGVAGANYSGSRRADLALKVGNKELRLNQNTKNILSKDSISIVDATYFDLQQKIYLVKFIEKIKDPTYNEINSYDIFELVSKINTMQKINDEDIYSFKANLTSVDPRAEDAGQSPFIGQVELDCTLDVRPDIN
jgi:hypothetical protein